VFAAEAPFRTGLPKSSPLLSAFSLEFGPLRLQLVLRDFNFWLRLRKKVIINNNALYRIAKIAVAAQP